MPRLLWADPIERAFFDTWIDDAEIPDEVRDQRIAAFQERWGELEYGPDSVSMAWQQMRYIAQLDYKMPQSRWKECVQLYEICNGENTITWHANPRQKTRQPSSLSVEKYAQLLGNYIPALISQKTGLPLLDLREPKKAK